MVCQRDLSYRSQQRQEFFYKFSFISSSSAATILFILLLTSYLPSLSLKLPLSIVYNHLFNQVTQQTTLRTMHYTVAITAALAASAAALPRRPPGFSARQTKNHGYVRNGLAEYKKALIKYGAHEHAALIGVINSPADGNVTTNPSDGGSGDGVDVEYLTPVNIGGQVYSLDFDTGSSDLWVLGSQVQTSGGPHTVFTPKSGDKPVSGEAWQIKYGDGSGASGVVYSETVNIGSVAVTKQAVEVATTASAQFTSGTNDGLVGLAFSTINTITTKGQKTPKKTFFQNAIDSGLLSKPVLGVSLKYKAPGSYDFGFIRSNASLAYTPVDSSQGFWSFKPSGIKVGGQVTPVTSDLTGIADTGTTLVLVPDDVVAAYYAGTGATADAANGGYYTFPCSTVLPDWSLVIGRTTITVPGQYINYDTISMGSSTCLGGIQSSKSIGINIYGDVFLKAAYVVFDATAGAPKLGFAQGV